MHTKKMIAQTSHHDDFLFEIQNTELEAKKKIQARAESLEKEISQQNIQYENELQKQDALAKEKAKTRIADKQIELKDRYQELLQKEQDQAKQIKEEGLQKQNSIHKETIDYFLHLID